MQNTSTLYKELIKQSGRMFRARIAVTFPDGSSAELTDENIMQSSFVITTGTSDEGSFSIGNAIIGQLDIELDNSDGRYDNMTFEDAEFDTRVALIVRQSYDNVLTPEWLRKGIFTVEEVTVDENYIKITAFDNMSKLDTPFSDVNVTFPITLKSLFQTICSACSLPYDTPDIGNITVGKNHEIPEEASCRDVISYIAQLACRFVYADVNGTIKMGWYRDTDYIIGERQKLSGSVTISGVQLTDTGDIAHRLGTADYCLMIDDNPIATSADALSEPVWQDDLIGMSLTPFEAEVLSDPAPEAGDIVTVSDLHGNTFRTPVTNLIYRLDGKMTVSCDAETVKEKQRTSCSPSAKIVAQAARRMNRKISEYDVRAKQFSSLTANAMGFYQTEEIQDDGSVIVYQHDKPLLADSQVIWKKSRDSFAVSSDGGTTWRGMDSSGNAVLSILAAVGIVADWLRVGSSVGGWVIESGGLSSADGSIKINSITNTVDIYNDGALLLQLNRSGVTVWDVVNDSRVEVGSIGLAKDGNTGTSGLGISLKEGAFVDYGAWNSIVNQYRTRMRYTVGDGLVIMDNLKITTMAGASHLNGITINGMDVTPHRRTMADGSTLQYWGWEDDS